MLKPLLGKRMPSTLKYNDSQFVRRRPKAPNPLSCKPKVAKERTQRPSKAVLAEEQGDPGDKAEGTVGKARTHKRVRKAKAGGQAALP